jgi:hypothetical protein
MAGNSAAAAAISPDPGGCRDLAGGGRRGAFGYVVVPGRLAAKPGEDHQLPNAAHVSPEPPGRLTTAAA